MYEERRVRFDWVGFVVKVILLLIFLLVMFKLFPIDGIKSVVDKVYVQNLTTMKDAAKSYYTTDRLPEKIGESKTMTLQEMINNKMVIEFTDKDNRSCDTFGSYTTVTKVKDDEYVLKAQLACGNQIDYILETIGCYDVCVDCKDTKITEYEFKKANKEITQVKGCPAGYTLNGNTCYKVIKSNYVNATATYYEKGTQVTEAKKTIGGTSKQYTDTIIGTGKVEGKVITGSEKLYIDKITIPGTVTYYCGSSVSNSATCSHYVSRTCSSAPSCSQVYTGTSCSRACSTCASVCKATYATSCSGGGSWECGGNETYAATAKKAADTYKCPDGYTAEGTGTSMKCYKNVATYSCETGYTKEGTGADTKCMKEVPTYSCPSDYTKEGTDADTKCYKIIANEDTYYCENAKATMKDKKCYLEVGGNFKEYVCPSGYIAEGAKCYKKTTDNKATILVNRTKTSYEYTWSKEETLEGWTRTGNTRLVEPTEEKNEKYDDMMEEIRLDSDEEINDRLTNVPEQAATTSELWTIILYVLIGLGFLYLMFMFISVRRPNNN